MDKKLLEHFRPGDFDSSYFLSFEGIEGSGKTTQIEHLTQSLEAKGYKVSKFREPGGTVFGEQLRQAILDSKEKLDPIAEAYLFASARAQLLSSRILHLLKTPKNIVILDRYIDSSIAYQGMARGLGMETILQIHRFAPLNIMPHKTFYLKIDIETSHARQKARGSEKDYFEKETQSFYQKLIQGYDESSQLFDKRFEIIDGSLNPLEISKMINQSVMDLLNN